ncbi:hypothetical protein RhiirA5_398188 [Rhizophagus irregularis]|uniref:Uncharacterized protein n=1 Tax=Rhizophagus irregularis TaxID=588596 RepID=A0A2N0PU24_9GLOM|nr:hypothetical protein RhiirA5_398188 [Rhizophagus irregularis]
MVKAYFSYTGCTFCGIPKITLEGTLEDWTKLQEKVVQLRQLDLDMDFWLDRLDPVVWKLVETYKGEIDEKFWATIASSQQYGSGYNGDIDGWMMAFFPYAKDGNKMFHQLLVGSLLMIKLLQMKYDDADVNIYSIRRYPLDYLEENFQCPSPRFGLNMNPLQF